MARRGTFEFDEIGHGSEIKFDIIRGYAAAHSRRVSSLAAIAANLKELGYGG